MHQFAEDPLCVCEDEPIPVVSHPIERSTKEQLPGSRKRAALNESGSGKLVGWASPPREGGSNWFPRNKSGPGRQFKSFPAEGIT